jgi:hypothetical protein
VPSRTTVRVERAIHTGEHDGTDVVPQGSEKATYWTSDGE